MPAPKRPREELNLTQVWHLKLGYIGQDRIQKMVKQGFIELWVQSLCPPANPVFKGKCQTCLFQEKGKRVFSYFVTFTNDYSRLGYVYLIKYKSEAFEKFKEFKNEVEKQTGKSIKILRSDREGEYLSTEFLEYLKKHGILSQWTHLELHN
ncbi:transposable element gene [Prunus dulcis]|uniref:Transposable element protein n=1 Tax=Prunus dulcis TaxID=3755 RepID=A0A4Y1RDH0_PRUDU|nr:transposable element gene [Prunus dulcis]